MLDVDKLTNAELDRLQERLTQRVDLRKAEREAAERERRNPRLLRPHIGGAGIFFANDLARRNWDQQCLDALAKQQVKFAVAPGTSVLARDGKHLTTGQEVRPSEHLDARRGDPILQITRLVEQGYVLQKGGAL